MHTAAFRAVGITASYSAYTVSDAQECMEIIRRSRIRGASITMPLKERILKFCEHVDEHARLIGAVNTLIVSGSSVRGYNTDWIGIQEAVRRKLNIKGDVVVIVGAGGGARAAVYAVMQNGGIPVVVSRGRERGETLARHFGCLYRLLDEIEHFWADGLINATPVGMWPHTAQMVVSREVLARFRWVMDMVYNPVRTEMLNEARKLGLETVDGVSMFVHQGAEQFRMWTGMNPPLEVMERTVRLALSGQISNRLGKV